VPRRVYVGGMPFWYTEEDIRACWSECGAIEDLTLLTFPDTGKFRGIVFVTFESDEGYEAALRYDGDDLDGKRLSVQRCKAAPPRHGRSRGHHAGAPAHAGTKRNRSSDRCEGAGART
jgi:RNA recognition motif-containing protein